MDRIPPLASTQPTADRLAIAVLDAIARRDRVALDALALSEQEFRDHVWPSLPAARPERNLPFSYVWGDLHQKSRLFLADTLSKYGGRRYSLEKVTFEGVTNYGPYQVYRKAVFEVLDASGQRITIRVCGSLLEQAGRWKVFSYVVDD